MNLESVYSIKSRCRDGTSVLKNYFNNVPGDLFNFLYSKIENQIEGPIFELDHNHVSSFSMLSQMVDNTHTHLLAPCISFVKFNSLDTHFKALQDILPFNHVNNAVLKVTRNDYYYVSHIDTPVGRRYFIVYKLAGSNVISDEAKLRAFLLILMLEMQAKGIESFSKAFCDAVISLMRDSALNWDKVRAVFKEQLATYTELESVLALEKHKQYLAQLVQQFKVVRIDRKKYAIESTQSTINSYTRDLYRLFSELKALQYELALIEADVANEDGFIAAFNSLKDNIVLCNVSDDIMLALVTPMYFPESDYKDMCKAYTSSDSDSVRMKFEYLKPVLDKVILDRTLDLMVFGAINVSNRGVSSLDHMAISEVEVIASDNNCIGVVDTLLGTALINYHVHGLDCYTSGKHLLLKAFQAAKMDDVLYSAQAVIQEINLLDSTAYSALYRALSTQADAPIFRHRATGKRYSYIDIIGGALDENISSEQRVDTVEP